MFQDREIRCKGCGRGFLFSAGEQSFYASRGFENEPSRCPICRSERRRERMLELGKLYPVKCESCERPTEVPFQPKRGRPVYCKDCYNRLRTPERKAS